MMLCSKCGVSIPDGDEMNHRGGIVCEDCYVSALSVPRTCDVAAVHSAKTARQQAGHTGTDGLTDLQKEVYDYVAAQEKPVPFPEMMRIFNMSESDFAKVFIPLRHCELLKATMVDGVKCCLLMNGGSDSPNT